ncbi:MAG: pantoate--beta-alanine ligase [Candidatus Raymondbacteria bacterium RIFOXYA2_FULL_49_16]|uniref:Pantothenate synthetase n=1 Tax=Candidatus Raymondbacteria bacterium RIFOXYD12_FULL_49_13 TaxID=1817890 RepID=A0A1F7FMD3_UNCRA|nr:MAG: pantoate--beta-alanine ligase [Candidatus Raymondbacteria bacterium RIFOXYA2_FULL_49_16]OGJ96074.1 MAG: pantoate--beta-alanine ligase [Candidatus Raymondbacteria bacterium RIFOXYC2_FULL_50_21]OGK07632.1 MAG: pantoate--beta-alanine ligase [Candidatus Raymondbacteria bacterium RIFOXYD12_FULL_49_13]OGP40471.1 MAG: pantoate--beta-alanine ligase [Candidatus Raymondbacteria bacterium RIFOXYB2_FULL_49_35]
MKVMKTTGEMRDLSHAFTVQGLTIGLVPTMGMLHEGHLSLIRLARQKADAVVVSIYVNPTQFGPSEDFAAYPRDLERDCELLVNEGVDAVFAPASLYEEDADITVDPGEMQNALCGKTRPGHFKGVATVVLKLFNIVQPHIAVFGQKDAQQAAIIRKMARDLDVPVSIIIGNIVREPSGLAMSSRNLYLSLEERTKAASLNAMLRAVQTAFASGKKDTGQVLRVALPLALGKVEYLEAVNPVSLKPIPQLEKGVLVVAAMRIGATRLIDNIILS